jgi:hypothetical protein
MISATNVAAPEIRMPSIRSSEVMSRRAAHCQQVGERRGVWQGKILRAAGQAEPRGLTGEPQGDPDAADDCGRGYGERLIAALRVILARRDLDDEGTLKHGRTLVPRPRGGNGATCRQPQGAGIGAAQAAAGASPLNCGLCTAC